MKWKSRLAVVSGAAAIALVVAGCSQTPEAEPVPAEEVDYSVPLSITWLSNEVAGLEAVVAAYQAEHPEADVTVTSANTDQYQAALRTELGSGTAADVVFVWPGNGNPAALEQLPVNLFVDLTDASWLPEYPEFVKPLLIKEDKAVLAVPAGFAYAPVYNENALDEAGLDAPQSWKETLAYCADAQSQGRFAYVLPANNPYAVMSVFYNMVVDPVYGKGFQFDEDLANGDTTFDSDKGYKLAIQRFQEMIDANCFQPDATGTTYEQAYAMLADGSALGIFQSGARLAALKAVAPEIDFKLYAFHSDDDESTDAVILSTSGGAAVNAKSENVPGALAFLQFLMENADVYTGALPGTIPIALDGFEPATDNDQFLVDVVADGRAAHFLNQLWPNAEIESTMVSGLQGILTGITTGDAVLKEMQAAFDRG